MGNERLKAAIGHAGLSIEKVAREAGVDPKTVQRWLSGRAPHPRHRFAIAQLVDEHEEFLWPGVGRRQADPLGAAAEMVAAYAYRSDLNADRWWALFNGAEHQIDLLGYTLYFLPHQHPDLVDLLIDKCQRGTKIRIAVADPESEYVRLRDEEEREAITLVPRIQSTLEAFAPLIDCPGADLRFQNAPLYNSLFRFDDEMLVTPHLYGTPGRAAPMMHLRRLGPSGMFSRFSAHFEGLWSDSSPIAEHRPAEPIRSGS